MRPKASQKASRESLFQSLHHERRIAALRFAEQEMHVLRHDYVGDDDKTIAPAHPLQHFKKQVAILPGAEQRTALVTAGGDEMEVAGAVVTMQSCRHPGFVAWNLGGWM